jgi:hypothetical protein
MNRRRLGAALAALAFLLALAPMGASAKENTVVSLAAPLPRTAAAGSTIKVFWSVAHIDDRGEQPLSGDGMYVRLIGKGATTEAVGAELKPGQYSAAVVVPAGGIQDATFGLRGTATYDGGQLQVTDMVFNVSGLLLGPIAPAPAVNADGATATRSTTTAAKTASVSPLLVLGGAGLALAALGLLLVRRRPLAA